MLEGENNFFKNLEKIKYKEQKQIWTFCECFLL